MAGGRVTTAAYHYEQGRIVDATKTRVYIMESAELELKQKRISQAQDRPFICKNRSQQKLTGLQ
jgi:hypothetical protein